MTKPYLILVNGVLAECRLTASKAFERKRELEAKGFKLVSVAYETKGA